MNWDTIEAISAKNRSDVVISLDGLNIELVYSTASAYSFGKDLSAFNNPKAAESIAINMFNQGATVVYHAAGGSGYGLFEAAKDHSKLAIGVDRDQGLIYATKASVEERQVAENILTSMLKRVDSAVFLTAKQLIDTGSNTGGYRVFGLADSGVDYAVNDLNREKLAAISDQVEDIKKKIISGEITVPDDNSKIAKWAAKTF